MTAFLTDDFLLQTEVARDLYHRVAKQQPIIDYHCHLPPDQVADNHQYENLTEIWLRGDHYKWRAMRTNGVSEEYCTGNASDWEKFEAWAQTVPYTLRNPLYHWTHLELRDPFGVTNKRLDGSTAREIYEQCNAMLQQDDFRAQGLLEHFNVVVVCSTDDPIDSLEAHSRHAQNKQAKTKLYPTWRPDKSLTVDQPEAFNAWVTQLESRATTSIGSYGELLQALRKRHDFFHELGCRASDHGLETMYAEDFTEAEAASVFNKARQGKAVSAHETAVYRSALLYEMALWDHERGWAQQFHLGAMRNNNTRMFKALGPDTGFDSMGDYEVGRPTSRFFDRLDKTNQLAKTILYNLNPRDNELMATMIGNFQDGSIPGKMQYGSGWWFMDQLDGMDRQMDALSNMGLLSRFVGMLTDSRSFLSYSRHEYFRRLLCNLLGNDVERGLIPDDRPLLDTMVADICYHNARRYFGFELPAHAPKGT